MDGELQVAHEREPSPAAALSLPALFALCAVSRRGLCPA